MYPKLKKQSGASIVVAIFLIVVLSLMGAGMVSLLSTSQQSISQEITSAKSYMAARSCFHWAMYQVAYFQGEPGAVAIPNPTTNPVGTHINTFNSDPTSGLHTSTCTIVIDSFDVDVNPTLTYYPINIEAEFGDITHPEYSKRTMHMQFLIE